MSALRIGNDNMPQTKFLVCNFFPDSPNMYMFHTSEPRFFAIVTRENLGGVASYGEFAITEIIDPIGPDGNYYPKNIFD